MMISDLEGLSDPNPFNPFILAIKSAFDVKRKGLYAASPTAEEDYAASRSPRRRGRGAGPAARRGPPHRAR